MFPLFCPEYDESFPRQAMGCCLASVSTIQALYREALLAKQRYSVISSAFSLK
jgi:hypothetical protein